MNISAATCSTERDKRMTRTTLHRSKDVMKTGRDTLLRRDDRINSAVHAVGRNCPNMVPIGRFELPAAK